MIIPHPNHFEHASGLNTPVGDLKGIGSKRSLSLAKKGIYNVLDLLFLMPRRYEDRRRILPIGEAEEGSAVLVRGRAISGGEERFTRSGKRLFRIVIRDETSTLELLWFNYRKAHLNGLARSSATLLAYGNIQLNKGRRQMIHPDISLAEQAGTDSGFRPVYPACEDVPAGILRSAIREAVDKYQGSLEDNIPEEITSKMSLPGLAEAVRCIHFPPEWASLDMLNQCQSIWHKRLVFDRFFLLMLNLAFRKKVRNRRIGSDFVIPEDLMVSIKSYFPFTLTEGQLKAVQQICEDIESGSPMNRLLQGDVGCGKTVVAAVTAHLAVFNNQQAAVMAPTQVLASQHYSYFSSLPREMGFHPVLLTGALKGPARLNVYEKIARGDYNLIIGTQALIQEEVSFTRLGLVVIDEQHRFGVRERSLLDRKGNNPHLLVMSATPIPRTLAMTVYADLDISVIREYPKGHRPVITRLAKNNRRREIYEFLKQRMARGEQGIVICPVIEGSETTDLEGVLETHERLCRYFSPGFRIGLIHGRMAYDEKESAMEKFRSKSIDLLVATSVIEVGVHAPDATVMIIEHPERFGLTQLHQLRGRIGRGKQQGVCILMSTSEFSEEVVPRLKVLVDHQDGFEIAQKDLELRGHGELMGVRQTGPGELDLRDIFREPELLMAAKSEAEMVLDSDADLSQESNRGLRHMIETYLAGVVEL